MHNISNQLYNYVSNLIIEYFIAQNIQPGDRYNLYLEENDHISSLYEALKETEISEQEPFIYTHPEGGTVYNSYCIKFANTKLIVASSTDASEDYFTMLRNKVAEQSGEFKGISILILFSGKLDSLLGGSGSLIKEGMPLHNSRFKKHIQQDIQDSSTLQKFEKEILKAVLERKTNSVVEDNNTIFDYEQVVLSLAKGTIEEADYCSLGLFKHSELSSKGPHIAKEINNNFNLYAEFENIFLNGSPEVDLKDKVSDSAYSKLINEDWSAFDFAEISRWIDDEKSKTPPAFQNAVSDKPSQTLWVKEDGESPSKKRNINILIFNPDKETNFKLYIRFDQFIKKDNIKLHQGSKNATVSNSGYSIVLDFENPLDLEGFYLVEYRDPETSKKYWIRILHLPFKQKILEQFEAYFQLKISKAKSHLLIKDSSLLVFNQGAEIATKDNLEINRSFVVTDSTELKLENNFISNQEGLIEFTVEIASVPIPFAVKSDFERPKPITGLEVWKNKRIHSTDYKFEQIEETIKLIFKNTERTVSSDFRHNLLQEYQIINSEFYSWFSDSEFQLNGNELMLNEEVKNAFNNYRNYFKTKELLPSLAHLSEELKILADNYVQCFIDQLDNLKENQPLSIIQKNLMWVGVVRENYGDQKIKFSPLHPINVAYQLLADDKLGKEDIYNAVLKRLNPYNLVPYLESENEKVYIPVDSSQSPEWLYYSIYLNSKKSAPKSYVSMVIADKIKDFTSNFQFLFSQSISSPIKINVINLGDCKEVVQGIFEYYKRYLNLNPNKRSHEVLPIEVNIYGSDKLVTKFEELTFYEKVSDVEEFLTIDLKPKNLEKEDLLNVFLEKVNFYSKKFPEDHGSYEYCHIAFYQFDITKTKTYYNQMSLVKTGLSLQGLMADVTCTPIVDDYRSGFGSKDLPEEQSQLTTLTCLYNSFTRVASNGHDYEKNKVICTAINNNVKNDLNKLYDNSQWVTYIDPKVDLDFFKENNELMIVHYSDQYSNSNGYDAITVTGKTNQYQFIIKEFLERHNVEFAPEQDTIEIINFFNAINGSWLLKLIGQNNYFPKEKLSILSGIKASLSLLFHSDILWIPVSLEEILRVSGNVGLDIEDGLFSAKNLSGSGTFSDDLIMIGLHLLNGELSMYLYPIELKTGSAGLANKGKEQAQKTASLIHEHLHKEGFLSEFYKNFFAKISLVNAEKMKLFHVWDNQNWDIINSYRKDLLNGNFTISDRLNPVIGRCGLIHFGKENIKRGLQLNEDLLHINLLEIDGYNFLVKSINCLNRFFHDSVTSIDPERLLANLLNFEESLLRSAAEAAEKKNEFKNESAENKIDNDTEALEQKPSEKKLVKNSGKGIEIIFGTDINNSKPVIWEPNNTNKVMHTNTGIIGTMGTGKTQFTKSLITQLYRSTENNIGNEKLGILIFDYKGDYIKDDFVKATNANVLQPHNLPYNPLALDATESSKPMLPLHTANDIKETISKAFNLGTVQKQKLQKLIIEAYESKGIFKSDRNSWSKTPPTIGSVCDLFFEDETAAQDSLYAAISNLSQFEIFESDPAKTKSLYSLIEGVVVINLSGYDASIQNLIVAITLDSFYTQMQRHGHSMLNGHERQIKKMILVDEADNFLSKNFNSIRKILKEGREFGVGTILSTQFLNHFATKENEYSNYIITWVIHRVNEIKVKEVDSLFSLHNKTQRENLISTIKSLDKHQSIVNLAGTDPIFMKDSAFWELIN